jgi:hypothetical protein
VLLNKMRIRLAFDQSANVICDRKDSDYLGDRLGILFCGESLGVPTCGGRALIASRRHCVAAFGFDP